MKKFIIFLALAGFILGAPRLFAEEGAAFKIIVNADNSVSSLSKDAVSKYFLKKITQWDGQTAIQPVDLPAGSSVRERFSRVIHDKTVSAIKNYWQQQIFSGRSSPPPEKSSDSEVIAYVKANPGAIGYVSGGADTSGVKVLRVHE
ncbi:MAG: substrate-binding domain-containing protein [bacterium]|nr:substrate-binding domain-containing protein [bacterium]